MPPVGISPAKADPDTIQARAVAITKRFINVLLPNEHARFLTSEKNSATSGNSCKPSVTQLISPRYCKLSYTHSKGLSVMTITSPRLNTSHLSANEEALLRCQTALELKDKEDYEAAQEVMRPLWKHVGARPEIEGLYSSVAVRGNSNRLDW